MSGALSSILGVGPQTTSSTSTPTMPTGVQQTIDELLARTRGFAAEPFQPYVDASGKPIPRVAEFTTDQQKAFENARKLSEQAGGLSSLVPGLTNEALTAIKGMATTLPNTDLSGYMSPYTQAVLDPMIRDINENAARQRLALGQQSARTGSFGGSRQAIAESELGRNTQRNIADTSAQQRAAAYTSALDQFRKDQQAIPTLWNAAQGQVGTALKQTQDAFGSQVNPLLSTGGLQQAKDQANLDVLRQQYEEERDFPLRGIAALRQTLGLPATNLGIGTASTSTTPSSGNAFLELVKGINSSPKFLENLKSLAGSLGFYNNKPATSSGPASGPGTTVPGGGGGPGGTSN